MTIASGALVPGPGERAVFVGQTGSGKTTLAEHLLTSRRFVVVLDAKGQLRWPDYQVCTSFEKLTKANAPKLIYRPSWIELQDAGEIEAFFTWVYVRRHCTCYVDELFAVTKGDVYPPHYGACLTRGRELGIEMWSATQRPMRVPQVALSESEHYYAFKLKLSQDRERIEQNTGISAEAIAALPKQSFIYSRQDSDPIGPLKLDLGRARVGVTAAGAVGARDAGV